MNSVARSSATLADQPTASGTPAPTSDWQRPAASACDVWQPLKKTHCTELPRKTRATISAAARESVRPRSSSNAKVP